MEKPLKITDNLTLLYVQENNWNEDKLLAVECDFDFLGHRGAALISMAKARSKHPSFGMIEMKGELFDSFENVLEANIEKILPSIFEFEKDWKEWQ